MWLRAVNTVWNSNQLHGAETLRSRQFCSYSRTSQHFMEHEGSLLCPQGLSIGPYSQQNRYSPYYPTLSLLRSILIVSTHLRLGLPTDFFLYSFSYTHSSPHLCYIPRPSHRPWLDHSDYAWRRIQATNLHIMQFSPTSCHFVPIRKLYKANVIFILY
jgi:hypothetical protein